MILLADIVLRIVDGVRSRLSSIVNNRHTCYRRSAQAHAHRIAQSDIESLIAFDERVFVDEDRKALRSLTGGKTQSAERFDVVLPLRRGDIRSVVIDTGGC